MTTSKGRRFAFTIHELETTWRPPRLGTSANDLPMSTPLRLSRQLGICKRIGNLNDLI